MMLTNSEKIKRWRKATKHRMIAAMGGKCAICGYDACDEAMDFHHINSDETDFGLGNIRANSRGWSYIVSELRKCVLLCCRCHREVHLGLSTIPEEYPRFDENMADYQNLRMPSTECPVCAKPMNSVNKTCSVSCSSKLRSRYDWSKYNLVEMFKTHSGQEIADIIGCKPHTLVKHLKKTGLHKLIGNRPKSFENSGNVNWKLYDLPAMLRGSNPERVAKIIGCSGAAVRKRIKKISNSVERQNIPCGPDGKGSDC